MEKKEICLADITTLSLDGKIYGHFYSVAKQYNALFKNDQFNVLGGSTYERYEEFKNTNFVKLPFYIVKDKENKFIKFIKEFVNSVICITHDCDSLVFQSYSKLPIYIALALLKPKAKVFMIEYQYSSKSGISGFFRNLAFKNIAGIITSTDNVGLAFKKNYITVPDYIYIPEEILPLEKEYDFAMLGTIAPDKDYEDVIAATSNTRYRVLLAGKFLDNDRFKKICSLAGSNVTILNEYLSDEDYYRYIQQSKFLVLPYIPESHNGKSSGVVLDSLYHGTPVIATKTDSFDFIEKDNLGIVYESSFSEVVESDMISHSFEPEIQKYLSRQYNQAQELREFIITGRKK